MADIQLLIQDDANRNALASVLSERHTPITNLDFAPVDLHLVDDASLPQYREPIEAHKQRQSPLFCPVVLIRREQSSIRVNLPTPETDDEPLLINELLSAPVDPAVLFRRIANLLSRRRQTAELKAQNDRLEEFASVVSHDLRNPLRVAEGGLELVREDCETDHVDVVANSIERMDDLIEDILMLARQGDQIGETEPVELDQLAHLSWASIAAEDADLRVRTDRSFEADASRLQQLLENLFRNAIEHGGQEVTITVGDLPEGFYVEDDGPGIPKEHRDGILEPGYSTSEGGSGFGLSIVRDIAEGHNWNINVTTGRKDGARFEFTGISNTGS